MNRDGRRSEACAQIRLRLPLFVGDELDPVVAEQVRAHLRDCARCRAQASGFLQARGALQKVGAVSFRPGLEDAFFEDLHARVTREVAAIGAGDTRRVSGSAGVRSRVPGAGWLLGERRSWARAAAALLLFSFGVLASQWFGADRRPGGRSAGGLLERSPIEVAGDQRDRSRSVQGFGTLQPLHHEEIVGAGHGMRGRLELRELLERELSSGK